jgi:hypothetical protein
MATSQLHEDFSREEHVKAGSDRGFGVVFAGVFGIVSAISRWRTGAARHWAWPVAAAFLLVALVYPRLLGPLQLGPDPADPAGSITAGFLMGEARWKELWVSRSLDPVFPYSVYIPTNPFAIRGPAPPGGIEAFVDRYGGESYSDVAAFCAIPEPTSLLVWSLFLFFLGSGATGCFRRVRRS